MKISAFSSSGTVEHNKREKFQRFMTSKISQESFFRRQQKIYCKTYVLQIDKYFKSQHCAKDSAMNEKNEINH